MAASLPATSTLPESRVHQLMHVPAVQIEHAQSRSPGVVLLSQMSRVEHDKLRLELREGMHRPVRVGPIDELGFGRLTIRERRLLREQLRRQSDVNLERDGTTVLSSPSQNPVTEPPRPETTDAALTTVAVPESVDVTSPVIESNK